MAQLFANENLPEPVIAELRRLGHDARTMRDAGQAGHSVPDREVLDLATAQNRAVVTLNRRHFVRLHDERPGHAGIIVCTFDLDFTGLARRIDEAIRSAPDLRGRLIRVDRPA